MTVSPWAVCYGLFRQINWCRLCPEKTNSNQQSAFFCTHSMSLTSGHVESQEQGTKNSTSDFASNGIWVKWRIRGGRPNQFVCILDLVRRGLKVNLNHIITACPPSLCTICCSALHAQSCAFSRSRAHVSTTHHRNLNQFFHWASRSNIHRKNAFMSQQHELLAMGPLFYHAT